MDELASVGNNGAGELEFLSSDNRYDDVGNLFLLVSRIYQTDSR